MSSNPPRDESGTSTSPVVADPTTSTRSETPSLPPQTENWVTDLRRPSIPASDTGRGWSLYADTEEYSTAFNQRSPTPPPRILTPSHPLTMSPECITPEQPIQQHSNPQPTSQLLTNPSPLSLLGKPKTHPTPEAPLISPLFPSNQQPKPPNSALSHQKTWPQPQPCSSSTARTPCSPTPQTETPRPSLPLTTTIQTPPFQMTRRPGMC